MAKDIIKNKAEANSLVGHNEIAFDGKDVRVFNEGKGVGIDDIQYHTKPSETILSASKKSPYLSYKYGKPTSYAEAGFGVARFIEDYNKKFMRRPSKESQELLSKSPIARTTEEVKQKMANINGVTQAKQQLEFLAGLQKDERQYDEQQQMLKANCGKDKYAGGKVWRGLADSLPLAASLGAGISQLAYFSKQRPKYQSTYAPNPYSGMAMDMMNKVSYNPYPAIKAARDQERKAAWINSQVGGISGGQRNMNRIALSLGAMDTMANIYANAEAQNNNLLMTKADFFNNMGEYDRRYRQNAYVDDREDYAKQSTNFNSNLFKSLSAIPLAIGQGYKNYRTDDINNRTLAMYQQELDERQKDRIAQLYTKRAQGQMYDIPEDILAYLNIPRNGSRVYKKRNGV